MEMMTMRKSHALPIGLTHDHPKIRPIGIRINTHAPMKFDSFFHFPLSKHVRAVNFLCEEKCASTEIIFQFAK